MHSKTLPCEPCPKFASICLRHLVLRQQDRNHNKQIYLYDTLKSGPQPSFCLFFLTTTISYSVHPLYLFFFFSLVVLFASFLLCAALSVVPLRHKAKGSRPSEWASRQMPDGAVGAYRAPMGGCDKVEVMSMASSIGGFCCDQHSKCFTKALAEFLLNTRLWDNRRVKNLLWCWAIVSSVLVTHVLPLLQNLFDLSEK